MTLKHAIVEVFAVTFMKAEKDNDDGRWIYEVEFYGNGMEYEYSIDAVSGNILDYDVERDN